MKFLFRSSILILILANLALAIYAFNNWQYKRPSPRAIPAAELTENELIKTHIQKLTQTSSGNKAIVALISAKSNFCKIGAITDLLKKAKAKSPDSSIQIILPREFNDQDIANFTNNLEIDFETVREDTALAAFWQPLAEKYNALGVIIVARDRQLVASQNVEEIRALIASLE